MQFLINWTKLFGFFLQLQNTFINAMSVINILCIGADEPLLSYLAITAVLF